jgi:hypothetical protein
MHGTHRGYMYLFLGAGNETKTQEAALMMLLVARRDSNFIFYYVSQSDGQIEIYSGLGRCIN